MGHIFVFWVINKQKVSSVFFSPMEEKGVTNSAQNMSNDVEECPVRRWTAQYLRWEIKKRKFYIALTMQESENPPSQIKSKI